MDDKPKIFIFSDESGSWHDDSDIYVRAWIVISEDTYLHSLLPKIEEINHFMNLNELKWSGFSSKEDFFNEFNNIVFKVFVTISSPSDISWETKYRVTRDFENSIGNFDFGEIDSELVDYLKDRIYRDIKNALFLHYYEKIHIENAKKGIESVIIPDDYFLIYRIDPPQMSRDGWKDVLYKISDEQMVHLEFEKSVKTQGIQFADLIAGAMRSFIIQDKKVGVASSFLKKIKSKFIYISGTPNPNLIMHGEIKQCIKDRIKLFWKL